VRLEVKKRSRSCNTRLKGVSDLHWKKRGGVLEDGEKKRGAILPAIEQKKRKPR